MTSVGEPARHGSAALWTIAGLEQAVSVPSEEYSQLLLLVSRVRFFILHCNCTYGHMVDTTLLAYVPHQTLAYSIHLGHDIHRSTTSNHISRQTLVGLLSFSTFQCNPPYLIFVTHLSRILPGLIRTDRRWPVAHSWH